MYTVREAEQSTKSFWFCAWCCILKSVEQADFQEEKMDMK